RRARARKLDCPRRFGTVRILPAPEVTSAVAVPGALDPVTAAAATIPRTIRSASVRMPAAAGLTGRLPCWSAFLDKRILPMTEPMRSRTPRAVFHLAIAAAALVASAPIFAQAPRIPDAYISGVVESANGPEAGVWVIAETTELKTPYVKIVVTDDDGRYVLPEMPDATYRVWVRGYGLADSTPVEGRPGDHELALDAVVAETPQEAAQVYPGDYWLSLLQIPAENEFPGTGPSGNGISPQME